MPIRRTTGSSRRPCSRSISRSCRSRSTRPLPRSRSTTSLSYGVQSYLTSQNLGLRPNSGSILNTQATTAPATTVDSDTGRRLGRRIGLQRLHQSRLSRLQFPDRIGNPAKLHPRCAARRHQRQGAVQPVAGRHQQPGGDAAGRRRGAGFDRQRHGADDQQHRRQHHRLSQHRHHPAGVAAHQRQRQCPARYRAGDQQRAAGHAPTA